MSNGNTPATRGMTSLMQDNRAQADDIRDAYAQALLGQTTPTRVQNITEQRANIQEAEGLPSIANIPVIGPVAKRISDSVIGWPLRALLPEGADVMLGKTPSGQDMWSWGERSRYQDQPISDINIAARSIYDLGLPEDQMLDYMSQLEQIQTLGQANTTYQQMMDNLRTEDTPWGYDPATVAELGVLRGGSGEDIQDFVRDVSEIMGSREATQEMREGYIDLEKKAVGLERSEFDLSLAQRGDFDVITRQAMDPGNPLQQRINDRGMPLLERVQLRTDPLTGARQERVLGYEVDRTGLRPTPEETRAAKLSEAITGRELTERQQIRSMVSKAKSAVTGAQDYLTALRTGNARELGSRGTLGDVIKGIGGLARQVADFNILTSPGYDKNTYAEQAARIKDAFSGIVLPNSIGTASVLSPADHRGQVIPFKFDDLINPDKNQNIAKLMNDGGYNTIVDRAKRFAQSVTWTAQKQAYYVGQEVQMAVVLAQLRATGRMSRGATSISQPAATTVRDYVKKFNSFSDPKALARYIDGQFTIALQEIQARVDTYEPPSLDRSLPSLLDDPVSAQYFPDYEPMKEVEVDTPATPPPGSVEYRIQGEPTGLLLTIPGHDSTNWDKEQREGK